MDDEEREKNQRYFLLLSLFSFCFNVKLNSPLIIELFCMRINSFSDYVQILRMKKQQIENSSFHRKISIYFLLGKLIEIEAIYFASCSVYSIYSMELFIYSINKIRYYFL